VIGDSISQGFMSGGAARSDLAYSALIAGKMGLRPDRDFRFPRWPVHGLPFNLEEIFRTLYRRYGSRISGFEWLTVLQTINRSIDQAEDFYERGGGQPEIPYPGGAEYFHNISVRGFTVADAWLVTPRLCLEELSGNTAPVKDSFLKGPDRPLYRTALQVLNPSRKHEFSGYSQLQWLEHHVQNSGVENTILWLGSNNSLSTVLNLEIIQTRGPVDGESPHEKSHCRRAENGWNLWHPDDFEAEYRELLTRVDGVMQQNRFHDWKVFLGTIPLVTIAPLAKGVGESTVIGNQGRYYKYYTYAPFEEDFARATGLYLTLQDALHIDRCIRAHNRAIESLADEWNRRHSQQRYWIVDVAGALNRIAYKRNLGNPPYRFPRYFEFIYPKVNTKFYHANREGRLTQGGLFSLDGIHPSAIGHGLIAWEFLKIMKKAGVVPDSDLDWCRIFDSDSLYQDPIPLMSDVYAWSDLAKHVVKLIRFFQGDNNRR